MNVMFHHLHGDGFAPVRGSVDVSVLDGLIDKYGDKIRYTFDDRLASQVLAVDLLNKKGLQGWFFVCEENKIEQDKQTMERTPNFYKKFRDAYGIERIVKAWHEMHPEFLKEYPFYTEADRLYRFIRDVLDPEGHEGIMAELRQPLQKLDLNLLKGHIVGLHSYSHPADITKLSWKEQFIEYLSNRSVIEEYGFRVDSMSHPLGRYNKVTFDVLRHLGIKTGFVAHDRPIENRSEFEQPRVDIKLWKYDI